MYFRSSIDKYRYIMTW